MKRLLKHYAVHTLLCILTMIPSGLSIAQEDTIYFNGDWFLCEQTDAKYYRIIEEVDTLLKVTDYYIKGGKQSEGFIENTKKNLEILKIRGNFEQKTIGDCTYYLKNGKIANILNMQPFHPTHGIDSKYLALLDSLDTISVDAGDLTFQIAYFKRVNDYGFLTPKDECHGIWVREDAKSRRIIKTARNNKNELNGAKILYYKSGIIRREMNYKDDVLHGESKKYTKKGRLVQSKEYENGVLKETWMYQKPKKK